ncbi:MAG: 2-C-methyl-D-erythritol 4-phosphate cytidylyltransferase [Dehalococcoidales bacterium]|nr:2-C-methyl-D-erythritol 4-phosphate cytidylyltransferase [Dehalococcoidales bacterium]
MWEALVTAIIVAAGESRRMSGVDKMFATLGGKPLLARTISVFQESPMVDRIILVVHQKKLARCRRLVADEGFSKVAEVCPGGKRRQDSVAEGLKRAGDCEWVIIHDGARPLVTEKLIADGLQAARATGAAIAAVPVKDTIKEAAKDSTVIRTLNRKDLWAVQTPQVFRCDLIARAYRQTDGDVTDDAALVEKLGGKVILYTGSYANIKVTTPDDLIVAEALGSQREM